MSEPSKTRRPSSDMHHVARLSFLVAICLLGFLYGNHFVRIATAPTLNNVVMAETHRVMTVFTEQEIPPIRPGPQEKAGMVPEVYWKRDKSNVRKELFESWLFRYIHHNLLVHPIVPYPTCQVYINHEYKFIWIKGHKVGSTALREPLGWLCDDHWKIPPDAKFDHCSHAMWRQSITTEDAVKYWREYFVFGVMRNPYDRFASAFEYIRASASSGACEKEIQKLSFENVCQDPYLHTLHCALGQCWCSTHHFRHFMPQTPCLLTESLLPAVDYLADISTLDADLEWILENINARRDKSLPALELNKERFTRVNAHGNGTSAAKQLLLEEEDHVVPTKGQPPEYVQQLYRENPQCLERVGHFFHQDFVLLGYDKGSRGN